MSDSTFPHQIRNNKTSGRSDSSQRSNSSISFLFLLTHLQTYLQKELISQTDENFVRKKRKIETLDDYWNEIQDINAIYHPQMNEIITHWNSRVNMISGKKFREKNLKTFNLPILEQIENILEDKVKLRRRTQLNRNKTRVFGKKEDEEENEEKYDPEIFDDSDFYQTLLTDILNHSHSIQESDWKTKNIKKSNRSQFENMSLDQFKKLKKNTIKKRKLVSFETIHELVGFVAPLEEPEIRDWGSALAESLFK